MYSSVELFNRFFFKWLMAELLSYFAAKIVFVSWIVMIDFTHEWCSNFNFVQLLNKYCFKWIIILLIVLLILPSFLILILSYHNPFKAIALLPKNALLQYSISRIPSILFINSTLCLFSCMFDFVIQIVTKVTEIYNFRLSFQIRKWINE